MVVLDWCDQSLTGGKRSGDIDLGRLDFLLESILRSRNTLRTIVLMIAPSRTKELGGFIPKKSREGDEGKA